MSLGAGVRVWGWGALLKSQQIKVRWVQESVFCDSSGCHCQGHYRILTCRHSVHVLGELDKLKWTQRGRKSDGTCQRCKDGRSEARSAKGWEEGQRGGREPLGGGGREQPMVLTCCGAHTSHSGDRLIQDTRRSSDTAHRTPQGLWWAGTAQWGWSGQESSENLKVHS